MNRKFLIIIAIMLAIPLITLSFKLVKSVAMIEQDEIMEGHQEQTDKQISKQKTIQQILEDVEEFKYYLDKGNESIAKKMKQMNLVIVEPIEMQQSYINSAQKSGTLVYGYINAMEGDKCNKELYNQLTEDDFYKDENGDRMYFEKWDSYMMDMTSIHYQDVLLQEIKKQVVDRELDGVFLDTVGNIDSFLPSVEQKEQNKALLDFIKKAKEQFNNLSIAQNWGFNTLINYTAPYIDFIMWEDFSYSVVGEDEWALNKMEQLKQVREEYGTQVMAVGFSEPDKSKELALKHRFKFVYNAAGSYYNKR